MCTPLCSCLLHKWAVHIGLQLTHRRALPCLNQLYPVRIIFPFLLPAVGQATWTLSLRIVYAKSLFYLAYWWVLNIIMNCPSFPFAPQYIHPVATAANVRLNMICFPFPLVKWIMEGLQEFKIYGRSRSIEATYLRDNEATGYRGSVYVWLCEPNELPCASMPVWIWTLSSNNLALIRPSSQ